MLAYTFHWPPSELDAMTGEQLFDWAERLDELKRMLKG